MHDARVFLVDLALVFCVATVATLVIQRLRQPLVLGYLVAGIVMGPHVPIPVFVDPARIHTLSELGVVLVMFSIGLELSLSRLGRLLPTSGLAGLVQITAMIWLGYLVGVAFGWPWPDNLFVGGMICISSTMIVSRVFAQQRVDRRLAESVLGVLVVQDLAAILLIAIFTAIATGSGLPPAEMARTAGELALFVVAVMVIGILVVPRLIREAHRHGAGEALLVASVGVCFGLALLAEQMGYSVALGAFAAGTLVSESGLREKVEHLIAPVRDVFAAVFFVSIGMLVDPAAIAGNWPLIAALVAVVVAGQTVFLTLGSFLAGKGLRLSIRTGMSLAQIGEFSFIIVGVGVTAGAVSARLYAVAVTVAVVTAFLTPYLVRWSDSAAMAVERRMPRALQTFAALYATWFESLGRREGSRRRVSRLWTLFAVDASLLLAAVIGAAVGHDWLAGELERVVAVDHRVAVAAVMGLVGVLAVPFVVGLVRLSRALALAIAQRALPDAGHRLDLAVAPRRAFVVALQLGLVSLVAFPLVAVSQPLLPAYAGAAFLSVLLAALGVSFWRSAANLQEHVRAGAEVVLEALGRQRQSERRSGQSERKEVSDEVLAELLPGLGELASRRVEAGSPAAGKTLAELNLRALTGATVLAIQRASEGVVSPAGGEVLRAGDLVSLMGTHDAIAAADELLGVAAGGGDGAADASGAVAAAGRGAGAASDGGGDGAPP